MPLTLTHPLLPLGLNARAHEPFPAPVTDRPCVRHLLNLLGFGQDFLGSPPLLSESLLGRTNSLPTTSRPWSSGIPPPSPLQPTFHLYSTPAPHNMELYARDHCMKKCKRKG